MGKEHDLLEAARTGNVATIEKLVSLKTRRASPLASLRKHVNINCTDVSKYTPLHLAALHGHKEAVMLLMQVDAHVNAVDIHGCTPFHLAAFNGFAEICMILIEASSSIQLNLQNSDGDTALHCACHYGHSTTVSTLLQHNADPSIRNLKDESPLDLASYYGHLDAVQQLLRNHPDLIDRHHPRHSPLHLAARNGHQRVVGALIDAGFEINTTTEAGTALHEATLYLKLEVVQLLLERGIDPEKTNIDKKPAINLIKAHQSQIALQVSVLIVDYIDKKKRLLDLPVKDTSSALLPTAADTNSTTVPRPVTIPISDKNIPISAHQTLSPTLNTPSPLSESYSTSTPTSSVPEISTSSDTDAEFDELSSRPTPKVRYSKLPPSPNEHTDRQDENVEHLDGNVDRQGDNIDPKDDNVDRQDDNVDRQDDNVDRQDENTDHQHGNSDPPVINTEYMYSMPKKPKAAAAGNSDPPGPPIPPRSLNKLPAPPRNSRQSSVRSSNVVILPPSAADADMSASPYLDMSRVSMVSGAPAVTTSPVKPPRGTRPLPPVPANRSITTQARPQSMPAASKKPENSDAPILYEVMTSPEVKESKQINKVKVADDVPPDIPVKVGSYSSSSNSDAAPSAVTMNTTEEEPIYIALSTCSGKVAKPQELEFDKKRISYGPPSNPMSPTNYIQPPTPDFEPPSPHSAVIGIQERINPQDKRKSRDMETITESCMLKSPSTDTARPTENGVKQSGTGSQPADIGDVEITEQRTEEPVHKEKVNKDLINTTEKSMKSISLEESLNDISVESINRVKEVIICDKSGGEEKTEKSSEDEDKDKGDEKGPEGDGKGPEGDKIMDGNVEILSGLLRGSAPGGSRKVVSQIYENVVLRHSKGNRLSTPVTCAPFDPLMEEGEINADQFMAAIEAITESAGSENDDVKDEWSKINDILSSFGSGIARESVFVDCFQNEFTRLLAGQHKIQTVGDWLESLSLGDYENTLVANGYDDLDFLGGNIVEESDLENIGIMNEEHRKKILHATKSLPEVTAMDPEALPGSIQEWLISLRVDYYDTFVKHKYDTMERVRKLWELELTSVLDISAIGHRRRILASLGERQKPDIVEKAPDIDWKANPRGQLKLEPKMSPVGDLDLFKDYRNVKPIGVAEPPREEPSQNPLLERVSNDDNIPREGQFIRNNTIYIRPPHLAHEKSSVKKWHHPPETLIGGSCNYSCQYLGSTLVRNLNGTDSTREGITKLKKSAEIISKIPTILLSISYKGVKFIDAKSKNEICEHEVGNIFCACQDTDCLNFFAYITKDMATEKHYCHVFSVRSTDLARDIILTLGEAFEIAYQMVLKDHAERGALAMDRSDTDDKRGTLAMDRSDTDDSGSMSSKASLNTL